MIKVIKQREYTSILELAIPKETKIVKPTGDHNGEIILDGEYNIEWLKLEGNRDHRYYFCVI